MTGAGQRGGGPALHDPRGGWVDPSTGHVYLTEDSGPNSGFYRFRPRHRPGRPRDLERGGSLEVLKVAGVEDADLRQATPGQYFAVEWVGIADQPIPGKPAVVSNDYRGFEFCGATFSPSGRHLFVNIQTPGITFAIEAPWQRDSL